MKSAIAFALSFVAQAACAQQLPYPTLKRTAQQPLHFVPAGWEVHARATGDLNKDGLADEALVLERSIRKKAAHKHDTAPTLPRMLLVLFKAAGSQGYALSAQSNSFILVHDDPEDDDPFAGLSIARGVLKIDFQHNRPDSHDDITSSAYKFRYDGQHFVLIGADMSITGRMSFTDQTYSYNFLTRKAVFTRGPLGEVPDKTLTKTLKLPAPKTLDTFTQPGPWQLNEDFVL